MGAGRWGVRPIPRRGSTTARGYGSTHQATRKHWARLVAAGVVDCARCGLPIHPDEPFDLDHSDDRTTYIGVSHRRCNRDTSKRRSPGTDLYPDHAAPFRNPITGSPQSREW